MEEKFENQIDWEARRFELVKDCLKSIIYNTECQITIDDLANDCVCVADAIIEKMKGGDND